MSNHSVEAGYLDLASQQHALRRSESNVHCRHTTISAFHVDDKTTRAGLPPTRRPSSAKSRLLARRRMLLLRLNNAAARPRALAMRAVPTD